MVVVRNCFDNLRASAGEAHDLEPQSPQAAQSRSHAWNTPRGSTAATLTRLEAADPYFSETTF